MQPKTKAWAAAVTGAAVGMAGLAVLAMPAGAGESPELPEITAQELLTSALSAEPVAFAGTVTAENDLGLPELPGLSLRFDSAQVWHDGAHRARVSIADRDTERTVVFDGDSVWSYNSAGNTATRYRLPDGAAQRHTIDQQEHLADPTSVANQIIDRLADTSTLHVDGTATVADRPAYELVLTPQPSERTLLREVKVAIDAETRLPLRLQVLTGGTPDPALSIGFSDFDVAAQPDSLFAFTPPAGASVTERDISKQETREDLRESQASALRVVGDGWDTVITGDLPADALSHMTDPRRGQDAQQMLDQFGERIDGEFGSGYLIHTSAVTGLLTDDGRFAVGAVPQQVLIEALEDK